ncbi:MAG: nuclear transport factor 2 family protein [Caldilineales bacterium]|nr:nuclear transport factor 2 family protein [Caldilineales bacterium]
MKTHQFALISLAMLLVLAACAAPASAPVPTAAPSLTPIPPTTVPEPTVDPAAAVVLEMVERVNVEDYAGAAELMADDMMAYLVGMPPTGMEIYRGRQAFQTFLEECCTGQHFVWEVAPLQTQDGVVYTDSKTWMDFTRELGVAPNIWHEAFEVKDGKITLYVSTITEDALVHFKPALLAAIPDLAAALQPPAASDETAAELNVIIADNTCTADGPTTLQAGAIAVNVNVQDGRFERYAVTLFTLEEGKDMVDLMASTYNPGPPSWSNLLFLEELSPGDSQSYMLDADASLLYLICWAGPPDTPIGNAGPFVVQQ